MKKKGFTLVELLAVIVTFAILILLALPNIMSLFNQEKQNPFENELKEIFKTAQEEWKKDSINETNNVVYARCKTENCSKKLSLSVREEIDYYVEVDKAGKIIKYYATDNSYQYEYNGTGLKIEEIGNFRQVANLASTDILTVTCSGATKGEEGSGSGETQSARQLYSIMAKQSVLDNVSSDYVTSSSGIDFSKISSDTNGKGVYELASTKDDTYPIYYYRGNVTDNNVKFAGFCWKAVRTTNTGGVKLIYNGTPDASGHCTNTTEDSTNIKYRVFNDVENSPAYVGYMYGTTNGKPDGTPYTYSSKLFTASDAYKSGTSVTYSKGTYTLTNVSSTIDNTHHYTCFSASSTCSTVYYVYYKKNYDSKYYYITITGVNPNGRELIDVIKENMFSNHRDSIAKEEIDKWYENNINNKGDYNNKIEDTVYCNDRSISDAGGWSPTGSMTSDLYFSGHTRTFSTYKPSLACERLDDRFTKSPSLGNGKLKYPVGLLTTDEIMLAGLKGVTSNNSCYLYTNQSYWVGSPYAFYTINTNQLHVDTSGGIYTDIAGYGNGLRPVISVSKNTSVTSGDGTANDPYVVE